MLTKEVKLIALRFTHHGFVKKCFTATCVSKHAYGYSWQCLAHYVWADITDWLAMVAHNSHVWTGFRRIIWIGKLNNNFLEWIYEF